MEHGGIWACDEDDLFYEELRRQILLLIAEEDEEFAENKHPNAANSLQLQQKLNTGPASTLQPGCYYHWSGNEEAMDSAPRWLCNVWNSGNGTGVFIPQIVKSRRRYKPRKKNNEKGRIYKQLTNAAR